MLKSMHELEIAISVEEEIFLGVDIPFGTFILIYLYFFMRQPKWNKEKEKKGDIKETNIR